MAWQRTDITRAVAPAGYGPADLQAAYKLAAASSSNGFGITVAIVDAFDDAKAEADLAFYRTTFGLPPCTTANRCFARVNQNGIKGSYPGTDGTGGWEAEESLDLDMVSAVCPNCNILLVEANTNSNADLYAAESAAAITCGASVVSNSWSGGEYASEVNDDINYFHHLGHPMTFASGDGDYPGGYPAAGQYVTAVGGTTLCIAGIVTGPCTGTASETVWNNGPGSGTGSLCSAYETQPAWQTTVLPKAGVCATRVDNDVAAIGDPNTGVAVYDTFGGFCSGWCVFGGTSVATPIIAGVYALADNFATFGDASYLYSHKSSFFDVTSGNNEPCPAQGIYVSAYNGTYICDAGIGFDGPTGLGTPNGIGGF